MGKDPAVLFYTSDFLTGTLLMTYEQKGKYMTLLCLQHQKGVLTEKDMLNICSSYDEDIWKKFQQKDGVFFNERMKLEMEKRSRYSESRRLNKLKGIENKKVKHKKQDLTYVHHMENENENINEIKDVVKVKNNIPEISIFLAHCREVLGEKYESFEFSLKTKYETWVSDGWKDGHGKKISNWKNKINNTIPFLKPVQANIKNNSVSEYLSAAERVKKMME